MIDDHAATKLGVASASAEPSPAMSSRRTRSDEPQDVVAVNLPFDGSAYSDPSFIKGVADDLLLLADCKRFADIGPVQTAKWGLAHAYQV